MMQLLWPGALAAQAIHAAARLGAADRLADGPRSPAEIAAGSQADAPSVRRLLRALASLGIFREDDDGRFSQTPLSETLRADSYVRPWAIMLGSAFVWQPWGRLYDSVRTGTCAFDDVFATPFHEYMATHPDEAEAYNTAMNANASMALSAVVAAYDFARYETIVDVGGGRGALLAGILDANPAVHGVLFDLPNVVAEREKLQVAHLDRRCVVEGGDFFEHVPKGDALVLKSIVHGLSNEQAVQVLRNCHRSIHPGGRLILVETVLESGGPPNPRKAMMDLMMFALTAGHERTAEQFHDVLSEANFEVAQVVPTDRGNSIIEAMPR